MNTTATTAQAGESFAELFAESLVELDMKTGSIVTGTVVGIDHDWVTVHAGLKSEGVIAKSEFFNDQGQFTLQVGDRVKVSLEAVEDGSGETKLSREKAKRAETWLVLEEAFEKGTPVTGVINGKVKGGFTVDVNTIRAFLPGSLVDTRPIRDVDHLMNKDLEFKLIKLDQKRNNVVVSRRAVLESVNTGERDALLNRLQEGQSIKGVVKNLTDYGAFVDLGGIDGLLHITDMSWKRIKHPSEIVAVGEEVEVKVLKFDRERNRVSLGLKQLGEDPWVEIKRRYPEGTKVRAVITNLTDYGCFAELEEGVEGLVHVSEMDWTNKNIHPSKIVQLGDQVEVMILDIDQERRRISLGINQCKQNPWDAFATKYQKGDRIAGNIKSITDFGIFIGLEGDIDGLVHLSDISWDEPGEQAVRQFTKGDKIDTVILSIDSERERISLGIKQMSGDPFVNYLSQNEKGSVVRGTVKSVEPKEAIVTLAEGVEGVLKASEISRDRVEDVRTVLNAGDKVELMITNVDRKNRVLGLSIKAKEIEEEKDSVKEHNTKMSAAAPATVGDLIKAKMNRE